MTKYSNFGKGIVYVFFFSHYLKSLTHNFSLCNVSDIIFVNTIDAEPNNVLNSLNNMF